MKKTKDNIPEFAGMSQQERDMMQKISRDRATVLWAAAAFIAALIIATQLRGIPS